MQKPLLVLDLDGTLISDHDDDDDVIRCRPGLQSFFQYAFAKFHIAIWTAASNWRLQSALQSMLYSGAIDSTESFLFTWHGNRCVVKQRLSMGDNYGRVSKVKPLRKIWRSMKEFDKHNTLIVDDTPSTFRQNYGNAIQIATYCGQEKDKELEKLQVHLDYVLKQYETTQSMRYIQKLNF